MTNSRNDRSFDKLPDSDSVVRFTPLKTALSNSSACRFVSSMNFLSEYLSGCSSSDGIRERALPEISSETTVEFTKAPPCTTFKLLSFSNRVSKRRALNTEWCNSSMLFCCISRRISLARPRNAAESRVLISFELRVSSSSAGRFSKAPGPSMRSFPPPISSSRNAGNSGKVCFSDISTTALYWNKIFTVSFGNPDGISLSSLSRQYTTMSPFINPHSHGVGHTACA